MERTFPDSEGIVRQLIVRTAEGVYRRDIIKLLLLEEKLRSRIEEQNKPVQARKILEQQFRYV